MTVGIRGQRRIGGARAPHRRVALLTLAAMQAAQGGNDRDHTPLAADAECHRQDQDGVLAMPRVNRPHVRVAHRACGPVGNSIETLLRVDFHDSPTSENVAHVEPRTLRGIIISKS
jgi:hypothetical protein